MKLTKQTVAALRLPPGKTDHFEWDDELPGYGLRLRLGSGGKLLRSFNVQYRRGGATRRLLLGTADVLSAEQARTAARKALAEIQLGRDPSADRRERRDKDRLTLRSLIGEYLADKQREVRPRTFVGLRRYLLGPYFKPLHNMPVDIVGRRDVAGRLLAIKRERGPIVAARSRAALATFFVWCLQAGVIEHNPIIGTPKPDDGKPRERVLSDSELAAIWRACRDDDYGRIIRLCILLGSRRQEIGGLRWSELDLESARWRLAAERSKTGKAHELPLMPMARAIVESVPRMASRDQLFGTRSHNGFTAWDREKQALDERCGVRDFTVHDVRRSFSTRLHDLGVAPHVVEEILAHRAHRAGSAGVYNRSSYQREVRAALALWESHLAALLGGGECKVVSFPQQSA